MHAANVLRNITRQICNSQGVRECVCKASPSDSLGSVDEDLIKELENMPVVLTTQDEMDVRTVVKGLKVCTRQHCLPDCPMRST